MNGHPCEVFTIAPGVIVQVWNARKLVANRPPTHRLWLPTIAECLTRRQSSVDWKHVRWGTLKTEPPICMMVGSVPVLIDGWHRCSRLIKQGRLWVLAHLLTEGEARSVTAPRIEFQVGSF